METPKLAKHLRKLTTTRDRSPTSCLSDGRPIDMVMAYRPLDGSKRRRARLGRYRRHFEYELKHLGLHLEYEPKEMSADGKTAFVKIHAPYEVLARQAELRKLRKPTRRSDLPWSRPADGKPKSAFSRKFRLQENLQYPYKDFLTEPFRRKAQRNFIGSATENFFTPSERAYLTFETMKSAKIDIERKKGFVIQPVMEIGLIALDPVSKFGSGQNRRDSRKRRYSLTQKRREDLPRMVRVGIEYLVEMKVYESVYALHDCDLEDEEACQKFRTKPVSKWPLRLYLYEAWVRPRQIFRQQPLDAIRDYYGERIALYFAYLGFYTKMLIPPAIIGVLVLIIGVFVRGWSEMTQWACNSGNRTRVICRNCPYDVCEFQHLEDFCHLIRFSEMLDNFGTVIFSLFIAIWAVCFIILWKRHRANLMARWNMSEHEEGRMQVNDSEQGRPEYEMEAPQRRLNPITRKLEPYFSKRATAKRYAASVVTISIFILVVIGTVSALMIYKTIGPYIWLRMFKVRNLDLDYVTITGATGAILNGMIIGVLSKIYRPIAMLLTKAENHRTNAEFEQSYVYKVVIFECINYYSGLFYLAFIRGQLPPAPNEQGRFHDRCPISGCLGGLAMHLAIIYSGKQIFDSIMEVVVPSITACCHGIRLKITRRKHGNIRCAEDHLLNPNEKIPLFTEYLTLLIQYGFVTMFVPAFPLAPLLALINNTVQIRIDAYKLLVHTRRSPSELARRDNVWTHLTKAMTRAAILTNALLIALTMDFVPKMVFLASNRNGTSLNGYTDFILTEFNTSDWQNEELKKWHRLTDIHNQNSTVTVDRCFYRDFRVSPWVSKETADGIAAYGKTDAWWHVLVTRLAFIIVFEHFIFLLQSFIEFCIPTVPWRSEARRKREDHLQREEFLRSEVK